MRRYITSAVFLRWVALSTLFAAPVDAAQYNVGPGHPYPTPSDVPWELLMPGDAVLIHARSIPYQDKWVIARQGTPDSPITIRGVAGPDGALPIIEGNGAHTRSALDYWNESRGIIKIGGSSVPANVMPRHIIIENLDIRNARASYTFTTHGGAPQAYETNAAAVYIEKGEHIVLRNNRIHDSGNGLFIGSGGDTPTRDILIEGNDIHSNGNVNSGFEHNVYTEALGITYQFNRFGPLAPGAVGNNLKDRSAGVIVRYNWIEGGNRQLDLVDTHNPLISGDPGYAQTFVYGNTLIERAADGNRQILMFGGDSGDTPAYRNGTLFFYNNTVVSYRLDRTTLFGLPTNAQSVDARNNIFYVTADGGTLSVVDSSGIVDLFNNWAKPGIVSTFSSLAGVVNGLANSILGSSPGFFDEGGQDFRLTAVSACRDSGAPLPAAALSVHTVTEEYVKHLGRRPRIANGAPDVGAYELTPAGTSPLQIDTLSIPAGVVGATYAVTLRVSGSGLPYLWRITAGRLPSGVSFDLSSGLILGTPWEAGTFTFTVQVLATPTGSSASRTLSLHIATAPAGDPAPSDPALVPGPTTSEPPAESTVTKPPKTRWPIKQQGRGFSPERP